MPVYPVYLDWAFPPWPIVDLTIKFTVCVCFH